jgi:hypothetical protein
MEDLVAALHSERASFLAERADARRLRERVEDLERELAESRAEYERLKAFSGGLLGASLGAALRAPVCEGCGKPEPTLCRRCAREGCE